MLQRTMLSLSLVFAFMIITGCSSQFNPATPAEDILSGQPLVGVSERFPDGSPASGMGALGIFNLSVNADEISAELTPLRQSSLTDVLEVVDITNFMTITPCSDCVKLDLISIDIDGNLVVSIGIKHPFPAGDSLKPVTGQNRGDLHVFNIEGTIVSDLTGTSFPGLGSATAGFALVSADGYTPYLDTVLDDIYPTDATVHPYILHFDDYTAGNFDASNPMGFESVTDPPPSGNLVMAMGSDYDYQDYIFDIDGIVNFIYAVGCTYAVSSASKDERFKPEYRVPQHNKKAASEVSIEIITNDLISEDPLSTAEIEIHVVDVSQGVAIGTNLDEMFADSSVGGITIDIPGVSASPVIVDISSPTGTGHNPAVPLVYAATITNTANGVEGTYSGLVKVVDSYSPGLNENPLLSGMDGIKRVEPIETPLAGLFTIAEFATYQTFSIDVAEMITTIFVDDSNTTGIEDGTQANPYNTIQEGLAAAVAGYEIWVDDSGNDYAGPITLVADVTLLSVNWDSGDGDDQADIHSTGATPVVTGADGATIDGFKVYGGSTYGISVSGVDTTISNCLIRDIIQTSTAYGVYIENSTGSSVVNCEITNIRNTLDHDDLYGLYVSNSPITITGNDIHDIVASIDYHSVYLLRALDCAPQSGNHLTITQNKIHSLSCTGGYTYPHGIYISGSSEAEVKNNLVYSITCGSRWNGYGIRFSGSDDVSFINNDVYDIRMTQTRYHAFGVHISSCANFDGRNNIVTHIKRNIFLTEGYGVSALADVTWEYCNVWDADTANYIGGIIPGTGCISVNPDYVNPGTDFHLAVGSPCIDTGDPTIFDPDSSRSDMGCYGGPGGDW